MFAAQLINDDGFRVCAIVATVLFAVALVLAVIERSLILAFLAGGAAIFALGWVLIS
jgi:hypothetical protein